MSLKALDPLEESTVFRKATRFSGLLPILVLALAGLTACSESSTDPADLSLIPSEGETFFLTLPIVPNAHMEALFQGQVVQDQTGCLRLSSSAGATVVWPQGFKLQAHGVKNWVVTKSGRRLGVIGGPFRFGGGEVPLLHEGLGYSASLAEQIQARCPGRFWIVGPVDGG